MAQCEEQGFSGVTGGHFAMFLAKAEEMGIPGLAGKGNSGEASRAGVTIRWAFTPETQTLTVQCTDSPMLLPCALINSKIREAVAHGMTLVPGAAAPGADAAPGGAAAPGKDQV